ncbi:urea transporter [Caminibacter mediatlanticus TB-2]|uniref:Urea transporter n=1 Tax=Caminibacter mediatlanticus TB-2 TaxID=391592 RepID=A0ABX5VAX0_9BACT|nr:urea transporter [Caminibacter mediatlanticus]QCT94537.1 urea transporter [Caminibacter mediatlanticus TB-2]
MKKIELILKPYVSIIFLRDVKVGIVLFFLSFLIPSVGILGLIGLISTIVFANFTNTKEEYLKYGFYLYNSLLVGMGIGYFYEVSFLTVILTIFFSILTFLISFSLNKVFYKYALPILSLPFAFVSMIFYLSSIKYTTLLSNIINRYSVFDINFPFSNFFKSLGTIVFLPLNLAGIVIFLILLFYSRIMAFLSVIGFVVGVYFHYLFVGEYAFSSLFNFNFILISIALGSIFLIPHIKSYLISLIAVILSVFLIDAMEVFFNLYNLPVYTLPFNIVVLLFLMLLYFSNFKYYNFSIKATPERSLEYFLSNVFRFGGNAIKINLPFNGKWVVYQAFDGEWTHKGKWKYAYDFVKKINGKSYKNDGLCLSDYYAFGENVVSPINGYIVSLRADLPDNPIGVVDRENNWGNYVIIKSDFGYYVEISHLMQNSMKVKVGDYVKVGDIIAKCGNSGYSPEPHIHIQVQKDAFLGSETLFFKWIEYIKDDKLFYYYLPKKDEEIEAPILDKSMKNRLTFILDDEFVYEDDKNNKIKWTVKMNDKGEFYLFDGENRLYFYLYDKMFYFYSYDGKNSYLKELFKIMPRIPLISKDVEYQDILPIYVLYKGLKKIFLEFILPFNIELFNNFKVYKKEKLKINSEFGEVYFNFYHKGFDKIVSKDFILRRKYENLN